MAPISLGPEFANREALGPPQEDSVQFSAILSVSIRDGSDRSHHHAVHSVAEQSNGAHPANVLTN